jgi:hypothetical protein
MLCAAVTGTGQLPCRRRLLWSLSGFLRSEAT